MIKLSDYDQLDSVILKTNLAFVAGELDMNRIVDGVEETFTRFKSIVLGSNKSIGKIKGDLEVNPIRNSKACKTAFKTGFKNFRNEILPYPIGLNKRYGETQTLFKMVEQIGNIINKPKHYFKTEMNYLKNVVDGKISNSILLETPELSKMNKTITDGLNFLLAAEVRDDTTTVGKQFGSESELCNFVKMVDGTDCDFTMVEDLNIIANEVNELVEEYVARTKSGRIEINDTVKSNVVNFVNTLAEFITLHSKVIYLFNHLKRISNIIPTIVVKIEDKGGRLTAASESESYSGWFNDSILLADFDKDDLSYRDAKILLETMAVATKSFHLATSSIVDMIEDYDSQTYYNNVEEVKEVKLIPAYSRESQEKIVAEFKTMLSLFDADIIRFASNGTIPVYDTTLPLLPTPRTTHVAKGYKYEDVIATIKGFGKIAEDVEQHNAFKTHDLLETINERLQKSNDRINLGSDKGVVDLIMVFRKAYSIYKEYISNVDETLYQVVYETLELNKEKIIKA